MMGQAVQQPDRRIKFSGEINAGHCLQAFVLLVATVGLYVKNESRITVIETKLEQQHITDAAQDLDRKEKFQSIRESLIDIRAGMNELNRNINGGKK
jgi:hypothetical protein